MNMPRGNGVTDEAPKYPKAPDLQEWVAKYGGYWNIPWDLWDAHVAEWEIERRLHSVGRVISKDTAPKVVKPTRRPMS